MSNLTLAYSTHRLETLELTSEIMTGHQLVILEEPPHSDFYDVLGRRLDLEEYLLEFDVAYPQFATEQYRLLQRLAQEGITILQVEPYLENLFEIQMFLADDHAPEDIDKNTIQYQVYSHEREATGRLIEYYQAVRGQSFTAILEAMQAFAKADGARFLLRDRLRADQILAVLAGNTNIYIEAGSMHLMLQRYLKKSLPCGWNLVIRNIEQEAIQKLDLSGSLYGPGDELTLAYMLNTPLEGDERYLLCAQALIFTKLVRKSEMQDTDGSYPHTRNELETIRLVRGLTYGDCRKLFSRIRSLSTAEAGDVVHQYLAR